MNPASIIYAMKIKPMMTMLVAISIFGISFQETELVSFTEGNLMYHFNDLDKQFPYINTKHLDYKTRSELTFKYVNELEADASCFVEWNGNSESEYYIGPKIKLDTLKTDFTRFLNPCIADDECKNKIEGIQTKIEALTLEDQQNTSECAEELHQNIIITFCSKKDKPSFCKDAMKVFERLLSLKAYHNYYFFKESAKWETHVTKKKWGKFIKDGEPIKVEIKDKLMPGLNEPEDAPGDNGPNHQQSILTVWDKTKFEEVKEEVVQEDTEEKNTNDKTQPKNNDNYAVFLNTVGGKPESQNFVVKRLRLKANPTIHITLICTHFKSKDDGFVSRSHLGKEISKYIAHITSVKPRNELKESFVIMGDLNGGRSEMAFNFQMNIKRVTTNPAADNTPEISIDPLTLEQDKQVNLLGSEPYDEYLNKIPTMEVVGPKDYLIEIKHKLELIDNEKAKCLTFCKLPEDTKKACQKACEEETKKLADEINQRMNEVKSLGEVGYLLETNNFNTQRKIRAKEINFNDEPLYMKIVKVMENLKENKFTYENRNEDPDDSALKKDEYWKLYERDNLKKKLETKNKFLSLLDYVRTKLPTSDIGRKGTEELKTILEAIRNDEMDKFKPLELNNEDLIEIILNSLLKAEKIDFIFLFLQAGMKAKVKKIQKMSNYWEYYWKGFPSDKFPSDHVPSRVVIEFETPAGRVKQMMI